MLRRCDKDLCRKCCLRPSGVRQHSTAGCTAEGPLLLTLQCIDTAWRGPQEHRLKRETRTGGGIKGSS